MKIENKYYNANAGWIPSTIGLRIMQDASTLLTQGSIYKDEDWDTAMELIIEETEDWVMNLAQWIGNDLLTERDRILWPEGYDKIIEDYIEDDRTEQLGKWIRTEYLTSHQKELLADKFNELFTEYLAAEKESTTTKTKGKVQPPELTEMTEQSLDMIKELIIESEELEKRWMKRLRKLHLNDKPVEKAKDAIITLKGMLMDGHNLPDLWVIWRAHIEYLTEGEAGKVRDGWEAKFWYMVEESLLDSPRE